MIDLLIFMIVLKTWQYTLQIGVSESRGNFDKIRVRDVRRKAEEKHFTYTAVCLQTRAIVNISLSDVYIHTVKSTSRVIRDFFVINPQFFHCRFSFVKTYHRT